MDDNSSWLASDRVIALFGDKDTYLAAMKRVDFDEWLKELEK